jgi:DNA-binding response OmpR family regulator
MAHQRVILVSGTADPDSKLGRDEGVDAWVEKPVSRAELRKAISLVLS